HAATARRSHSGTTILDSVIFIGGLGTAAATDTTPLKSISTLYLKTGNFTETNTVLGIYNHAGTTSPFNSDQKKAQIGLSFGQTTGGVSVGALDWVGPLTGMVEAAPNTTSTIGPFQGQPLAARAGHSMVQHQNNNLWVFGGYLLPLNGTPTPARDTPMFDYSSKIWRNQTKVGLLRFGHASAKAYGDYILSCYGTIISARKDLTAPCIYFSISTTVFTAAKLVWADGTDEIEDGLIGHTLVTWLPTNDVDSGILYMFGGTNEKGDKYNQNLYKLDTTKFPDVRISKMKPPANPSLLPSARTEHVAVAVGTQEGFMIIQGGATGPNTMADAEPYFYRINGDTWLDRSTFVTLYNAQLDKPESQVSVWVLIAGIVAGVAVLGGCVGMYIWRGIRKDEAKRLEREAADQQSDSPDFVAMEAAAADKGLGDGENRKSAFDRKGSASGRTKHPIYGMAEDEDHSPSNGLFKSTSSLIQGAGEFGKSKPRTAQAGAGGAGDTYQSNHSKPWVTEPASPGGTTLMENGSINGYFSSNSTRLNKKGSNASTQHSQTTGRHTPLSKTNSNSSNNNRTGAAAAAGGGGTSDAYYNPRDLYVDEDDDSSITVSLASESSTMSPWTGPVRLSTDLAPPNPRFSRGAIPLAHRQLVDAIASGAASPMPMSYNSNRNSNGWDTSSPGGSLSSRDDEYHRRSVNSMQWVSFEPMDLAGRPESQIFDPPSQRSNLTVRNASMYRTSLNQPLTIANVSNNNNNNNTSNNQRMSMFGGSSTSDTNTEDSGSYYGPGGKRISTALAARQQRRSIRNSQDSLNSASESRYHQHQQQQQQRQQRMSSGSNSDEVFVTKVLPIITSKVTKPTLAKVVTHQRGSRIVVPSAGPLGDHPRSPPAPPVMSEESGGSVGGLGIDFSVFSPQDSSMSGYGSNTNNSSSNTKTGNNSSNSGHRSSYQTRRTSNLNPSKLSSSLTAADHGGYYSSSQSRQQQQQQQRDSTNVILKLPPAPKHVDQSNSIGGGNGGGGGGGESGGGRSHENQQQAHGVRTSIMEMGQDLSGYF
ncbi:hypothetical protein BGX23_002982, partial [Mortierella sp. AD031]